MPDYFTVRLKRPIGLHVLEGPNKGVFVQYIKPDLGAAKSKKVEVGDQLVAMSASWGDRMWEINSVESFVVGVRMRTDSQLSFKLKRTMPLLQHIAQLETKVQRQLKKLQRGSWGGEYGELAPRSDTVGTNAAVRDRESDEAAGGVGSPGIVRQSPEPLLLLNRPQYTSFGEMVEKVTNGTEVWDGWAALKKGLFPGFQVDAYTANKIMTTALRVERPDIAVKIFEDVFGFRSASV